MLLWEPPRRVVIAWQINAQWAFDPSLVTEVDVQFLAQADGSTEVTLEHRNLERLGADAAALREGIDGAMVGGGLLEGFAAAFR